MNEKRFPAKGMRATLHPILDGSKGYFFRLYDAEFNFKDYDIIHYDLDVIIWDESADFIETEDGEMYLDYSLESVRGE
jgi:hypothetical protein